MAGSLPKKKWPPRFASEHRVNEENRQTVIRPKETNPSASRNHVFLGSILVELEPLVTVYGIWMPWVLATGTNITDLQLAIGPWRYDHGPST